MKRKGIRLTIFPLFSTPDERKLPTFNYPNDRFIVLF